MFDQKKGGFIRENHHLSWVHIGKSSMNGPGKCSIDMFNNQMVLWKSGWFQERCGLLEGKIRINSKKWYVHQEKLRVLHRRKTGGLPSTRLGLS